MAGASYRGCELLHGVPPRQPSLAVYGGGEGPVGVTPLHGGTAGGGDRQRVGTDAEVRGSQIAFTVLVGVHRRGEGGDDDMVNEAKDEEERDGRGDGEDAAEKADAEIAVHHEVERRLGTLEDEALEGVTEVGDILCEALVRIVEAVVDVWPCRGWGAGRGNEEGVLICACEP